MKGRMQALNGDNLIDVSSPMAEVAQILAAGLLRLKRRESGRTSEASTVSEDKLDVSSEKSVNVMGQFALQTTGQIQSGGE